MIHRRLFYAYAAYAACAGSGAHWDTFDVSTPAGRCCSNRSKAACRKPPREERGVAITGTNQGRQTPAEVSETPAMVSATGRFEGQGTTSGCGRSAIIESEHERFDGRRSQFDSKRSPRPTRSADTYHKGHLNTSLRCAHPRSTGCVDISPQPHDPGKVTRAETPICSRAQARRQC
jgi:hypothetical protein